MAIKTYSVGGNSQVRRLDDLGSSWVSVPLNLQPLGTPINVVLRDVMTDPINPEKVIAVGGRSDSTGATGIYVSYNSGGVWEQPGGDITDFSSNVFNTFWEVWFVDSDVIYACGNNGYLFKSIDGGATFNRTTALPTNDGLPSVNFPSFSTHFITPDIGIVGSKESIFKTVDGGTTWTKITLKGNGSPYFVL